MSRNEIAVIVHGMLVEWRSKRKISPRGINCGWCGVFARELAAKIPGSKARWKFGHVYVSYLRRYYDSEAPRGVDRVRKLPFNARSMHVRLTKAARDCASAFRAARQAKGETKQPKHNSDADCGQSEFSG